MSVVKQSGEATHPIPIATCLKLKNSSSLLGVSVFLNKSKSDVNRNLCDILFVWNIMYGYEMCSFN